MSENTSTPRRLDGRHEEVEVVIEQLEIIGDFLYTTHGRGHYEHPGAGCPSDGVWRLQVEIRLYQDELHILTLHLIDQVKRVTRRWGNTWPWFHIANDVQAKASG